jgi:hypothetical protein
LRMLSICKITEFPSSNYRGRRGRQRAADLYAQGWTLRQIGAALGVTATRVGNQLCSAGVPISRPSGLSEFEVP